MARPSWVNLAEKSLWSAPTDQGKHVTGQEEDPSDLRPWSSNQGIRVRWAPVSKVRIFQPTGMHTYLKDESVQPTFACSSAQCDRRSRRWAKKHGGAHEDVPSMPAFQPTDGISQLRKLWNDMPPWTKRAISPSPGPSDKSSESADAAASLASAATTPQVMGVEEMWQNDGQEELSEDTPSTQAQSATACVAPMGQMEGRAEAISGQFNSQHVANTLWAYATMGKKPGERVLGQLEGRAEATSGELNSQAIAKVKTSIAVSFAVPSWQHGFDWRTSGGKGGETERGRDRWREGEREDLILSLLPSKSGI